LVAGGIDRSYIVHIPPNYDASRPTPVVFIFHGFNLKAEDMIRISGFNTQADSAGFIAVYPQGGGKKPSWNGGRCCGEAQKQNVDDVGFIRLLLGDLGKVINVDTKRVYATGFSNGAIMSYRLGCDLADQIAAIAPVSAAQETEVCQPSRPLSVIYFHGTADKLNPYDGGSAPTGSLKMSSVKDSVQFWVQRNACPTQPKTERSRSIVHDTYAPCEQSTAVELYTIEGGEHAWPGGEAVSAEIGKPTMEISATQLMWEFFMAHPLP
jgi:polyhydroxybutyrate depolymerase